METDAWFAERAAARSARAAEREKRRQDEVKDHHEFEKRRSARQTLRDSREEFLERAVSDLKIKQASRSLSPSLNGGGAEAEEKRRQAALEEEAACA